MSNEADPGRDEQFTQRLAACDEALAAGAVPDEVSVVDSPELRARLERGLACVRLLQQLRPERPAPSDSKANTVRRPPDAPGALCPTNPACPARIGRFEILRPLGRGGFGIVYLAHDPVLRREVALKIPRADALADADCRARFQREARAMAALDHPNLVHVHEAGEIGPVCYIALAYCPGENLAEWLRRREPPVACAQAAQLIATLARAVHYAHTRGVLHRDLKPSNVMLSRVAAAADSQDGSQSGLWLPEPGSAFVPRVTDFGLARLDGGDGGQTCSGAVLCTPDYMAPEQTGGRAGEVGPWTDVWALGAILYELLTGRPPFWGDGGMDTLWQVKTVEPVPPGRVRQHLPRDLETICLKCLHKEPRRRYASAEALAEDLRRFLAAEPIKARPVGRTERVLKWARRRPGLAAALAALAVVTALGVGGILMQWRQTQEALADEAQARAAAVAAQQAEKRAREKSETLLSHQRVALAYREWSGGNGTRAAALLDECRADLRGWEWRYVRRLCDSAPLTLEKHTGAVRAVAFSPDGRRLASVAGKWFSNDPGEVKLWDTATGRLLWTGRRHTGPVLGGAFSPDGRRLVSVSSAEGGNRGEGILWETATGEECARLAGLARGSYGVAWSPDGRRLATAGPDGKVRLWDPASGQRLDVLAEHVRPVWAVAFSPDGGRVASASFDGTACVWETAGGTLLHRVSRQMDLRAVAFSPDGGLLATASFEPHVKIWDSTSGRMVCANWRHAAPVLAVAFAPDGRGVASADKAGNVLIWRPVTGYVWRCIRGHTGAVGSLGFSPDGRRLAAAGNDGVVRIWDVTREQDGYSAGGETGPAQNVCFSRDGKYLAATGWARGSGTDRRLRVWATGDLAAPPLWERVAVWPSCLAFRPDGKVLASGTAEKTLQLWDAATGKPLGTLAGGHTDAVMGVSFNPDGSRLASASLDRTVRMWDVDTGQLLSPVLRHPQKVKDVAFAPQGGLLVAVGLEGMVRVWDTAAWKVLADLRGHEGVVERVQFSADGSRFATAGGDLTVWVWDTTAGLMPVLRQVLSGHTEPVVGLSFSADGRGLVSGSWDATLRLWDVDSGTEVLSLRGHRRGVKDVAFSPDGRMLVSASSDLRIWDADDGTPAGPEQRARAAVSWHLREAVACLEAQPKNWFGFTFHIDCLLEARPGNALWHGWRGDGRAELGRRQEALDDYARALELGTTDWHVWHGQARARLLLGDTAGYRRACAAMLERFGRTGDAQVASGVAWTCGLGPAAVADLDWPIRLAEKAIAGRPERGEWHNTLGILLYRAGRYPEALTRLQEAVRLRRGAGMPEDFLFLAMVQRALGQDEEARGSLAKGVQWLEAAARTSAERPQERTLSRSLFAVLQLFRREAEAALATQP